MHLSLGISEQECDKLLDSGKEISKTADKEEVPKIGFGSELKRWETYLESYNYYNMENNYLIGFMKFGFQFHHHLTHRLLLKYKTHPSY